MTPCNKIKREILLKAIRDKTLDEVPLDTDGQVDAAYDALYAIDANWDYESEFRGGQVKTAIPAYSTRHYEARSVAAKCADGSWVGWTYWYGGGKHGEPAAIEWMSEAYDLTCVEEEKLVVVRTFAKVEVPS